jgi:hypothetical protein
LTRDGRQISPCITNEEKTELYMYADTVDEVKVGEKYNLWGINNGLEIWIKVLKKLEGISYAFVIKEIKQAW